MQTKFKIVGNHEYAVMEADFSVVQCFLQDTKTWGSRVVEKSGEQPWKTRVISFFNRWLRPSRIKPLTQNEFFAKSILRRQMLFAYSITRGETENTIIITPHRYISVPKRILITLFASLFLIFPAFFSPLFWKRYQNKTLLFSKKHLASFCLMVEEGLNNTDF